MQFLTRLVLDCPRIALQVFDMLFQSFILVGQQLELLLERAFVLLLLFVRSKAVLAENDVVPNSHGKHRSPYRGEPAPLAIGPLHPLAHTGGFALCLAY